MVNHIVAAKHSRVYQRTPDRGCRPGKTSVNGTESDSLGIIGWLTPTSRVRSYSLPKRFVFAFPSLILGRTCPQVTDQDLANSLIC